MTGDFLIDRIASGIQRFVRGAQQPQVIVRIGGPDDAEQAEKLRAKVEEIKRGMGEGWLCHESKRVQRKVAG